jgi:hypothetical protein
MLSFILQAFAGLIFIGLPLVALYFIGLVRSGKLAHRRHDSDPGSTTFRARDGRIYITWRKPRFYCFKVTIMAEEDDLELFVGLGIVSMWITFKDGALFSRATRERFWRRWGKYKARVVGVSYHSDTFFFSGWEREHESSSSDPKWWHFSVSMPWHSEWGSSEVLSLDLKRVVFREDRKGRLRELRIWRRTSKRIDHYEEQKAAEEANSEKHQYLHITDRGEDQMATATIHVDRMAWGYRWLPFPFKVRTYIDVMFDREMGNRAGSWKGGTIGCSYEMKPGETPLDTLRRMEADRSFNR